ncbi:MAG: type II toxin-antitoxin system RelE/ParE family toxin [Vicinamibacterales bacterium]
MVASFHDLAKVELNEAAEYYEREHSGLGATFVAEVERSTTTILEHPEASPIVGGTIRRKLLRRFPYALLYRVRAERVRVLAIMNLKRRPGYWVGRS